jgi:HEPN domain-containing protein
MNDVQPPEMLHLWLQRARSDLALGEAALQTPGVLPEDACFHAQQCAEKALKGLLSDRGIPFPRTHVLEVLLDLLKAHGVHVPEDDETPAKRHIYSSNQTISGDCAVVAVHISMLLLCGVFVPVEAMPEALQD